MTALCYCCGELPTPAPTSPPSLSPTLEPTSSRPTYTPTVSAAPTTYEYWFENHYAYSYTHPPSYVPTEYASHAPTNTETVEGYYLIYIYYDFPRARAAVPRVRGLVGASTARRRPNRARPLQIAVASPRTRSGRFVRRAGRRFPRR